MKRRGIHFLHLIMKVSILLVGIYLLFLPAIISSNTVDGLNSQANTIRFKKGGLWTHFQSKLAQAKKGKSKLHIFHIGDSHIQADFFSGEVRRLFTENATLGKGGRGFIYPYSAAQTNNPSNYKVKTSGTWVGQRSVNRSSFGPFGLAGVYTETSSTSATITIDLLQNNSSIQDVLRVFCTNSDSTNFTPLIQIGENTYEAIENNTELGYYEFRPKESYSSFTLLLKKSSNHQKHFGLQGFYLDTSTNNGLVYSSSGVNGAEVPTYFRCVDFDKNLKALHPDMIIVSLGTNDAYGSSFDDVLFKANCIFFVEKIRRICPNIPILFTGAGDNLRSGKYSNYNNEKVREVLLEMVDRYDVAFWDFFTIMGGINSVKKWKEAGLAQADYVHLTIKGYQLQGKLLYEALIR